MEDAVLGRTGRRVSRLGFGGAPAGLKGYLHDYDPSRAEAREQVVAAIRRALELGVTYFDTAPGYGSGASEEMFGQALEDAPGVFLATKCAVRKGDFVRPSLEQSLQRLRRPCVDLLQLHGSSYSDEAADRILAPGGALEQMEQAREEGLIRFIGFTTEDNNKAVYRFIESGRFDVVQLCYNLFFQHPYDARRPFGSILEAEKHGVGVAAMRVMTSGLFRNFLRRADPDNRRDFHPHLLQFVLSNPRVHVALVGMRTPDRVDRNVAVAEDLGGRYDIAELFDYYPGRR
jgi:aryl-alcohol dehydrogenase-like predicted oxidoreductase